MINEKPKTIRKRAFFKVFNYHIIIVDDDYYYNQFLLFAINKKIKLLKVLLSLVKTILLTIYKL